MLQIEKIRTAVAAIDATCGHCEICSPECPIAIARRAMEGLLHDLEDFAAQVGTE